MCENLGEHLSIKQQIEKATAEIFLKLFNNHFKTVYQITSLSDSPDIKCIDKNTNLTLNLEITLLEDINGEIGYLLGKGKKPFISPNTGLPCTSFSDDSIPKLEKRLDEKGDVNYGQRTALVIRQTSPLWFAEDWASHRSKMDNKTINNLKLNYEAGVWIICTNNNTWPAKYDIYELIEHSIDI